MKSDGNFYKVPKQKRRPSFASSSSDGTIYFWSLPRSFSTTRQRIRSPLHLTISPIYQLVFEEQRHTDVTMTPITITSFCLLLAKSEESSSLNIRDQSDLNRLKKIIVGTNRGEIICCSWGENTVTAAVVSGEEDRREICKILTRCSLHDGIVRTMSKSTHLDDVYLSVGGRIFALWKEEVSDSPIYQKRSKVFYGEGCWSTRAGMFILSRLDGCFEVWNLKWNLDEPVLLQHVSDEVINFFVFSFILFSSSIINFSYSQTGYTLRVSVSTK